MQPRTQDLICHRCPCGYEFAIGGKLRDRPFESFAVIQDRNYKKFLRSEYKALQAESENLKMRQIARSAKLAGALIECPQRLGLIFILPDDSTPRYYSRMTPAKSSPP